MVKTPPIKMVIWGMIYYCYNHINTCICIYIYLYITLYNSTIWGSYIEIL